MSNNRKAEYLENLWYACNLGRDSIEMLALIFTVIFLNLKITCLHEDNALCVVCNFVRFFVI